MKCLSIRLATQYVAAQAAMTTTAKMISAALTRASEGMGRT